MNNFHVPIKMVFVAKSHNALATFMRLLVSMRYCMSFQMCISFEYFLTAFEIAGISSLILMSLFDMP